MVCTLLMIVSLCTGAMAQKNIDRIIEKMDKRRDVQITSVQKRDPETRKVVRLTKTLRISDPVLADELREAFEKDEKDALTIIKETGNNVSYTLKFQDKREKRTYILNVRNGKQKTLEVSVFISPIGEMDDTAWWDSEKFKKDMQQFQQDLKQSVRVENGKTYVSGDVYMDGKKMKKGTHKINGRTVIVR